MPCSTGKILGPSVFFLEYICQFNDTFCYTLIIIKIIWWQKHSFLRYLSVWRLCMLGLYWCLKWCWNTILYFVFKNSASFNQLQAISVFVSSVGCLKAYKQVQILTLPVCWHRFWIFTCRKMSNLWGVQDVIWEQGNSPLKAVSLRIKTKKTPL